MVSEYPTEIQEKAIPEVLKGSSDILGIAQTGTGKTAAFGLPMLNMLDLKNKDVQGLVVAPTRELAIQITDELNRLKGKMRCSIATVYGGQSYELQFRKLRDKPAIIVGTPGRLIDHLNRKSIKLSSLRFLVLDEADDMLNMGFVDDVEKILEHAPEKKQMLLFSATMPRELKKIVNKYMSEDKVEVVVKKKTQTTTLVSQHYMDVYREDKLQALRRIIDQSPGFYGIVFCRTKNDVDTVNQSLVEMGYSSEALHGDISQAQREKIIRRFKAGRLSLVIATDVASRGVDVKGLNHVINYELPQDVESYVHRDWPNRTCR